MRCYTLQREQWVASPLQRIFPFFAQPENLALITPPSLGFRLLTPLPVEMEKGVITSYSIHYTKLYDCNECNTMMKLLSSPEMLFADAQTRADESAKFLRHLTYNHNEVVQAVMEDLPKQKRDQEFDFFK